MKHYEANGQIYCLDPKADPARWLPKGFRELTQEEVEALHAPPPETLADQLPVSLSQMAAALAHEDIAIITEEEALGWIDGVLPAAVTEALSGVLAAMPVSQRIVTIGRAKKPSQINPTDPIVQALAGERSEAEMISLFKLAASL